MDVAIVGIGIHPFGRHDGVSDVEMGVHAARQALRDAGVEWSDVQFAYGGSLGMTTGGGGASADTMVGHLGLTGLPFVNVSNGCATAGSALAMACSTIESGQFDLGLVVGFDKHARGAFDPDPAVLGLGKWYGDVGISLEGDGLVMRFSRTPLMVGDLEHWQYDTFLVRWRDRALRADAFVTFQLEPDGEIERVRMEPASPTVDFSYDFEDLDLQPKRED